MRGHVCSLLFLAQIAGQATGMTMSEKKVTVCGETFTEAQIVSGQAHISEAVFMVGVDPKEQTAALLEAAKAELAWEPHTTFANIGLFWGTMGQDQVLWFMRRDEIKYIQADCQTQTATGGASGAA
ncbi:unnamed protein product [Prorocentrum cordatum]|uniref:Uncharacterized protein n=1 Tax=Prorocentrum cordatum TaxID=2364126 RepID=A0ABN9WL68_9DINO|nr:unnamed protein product [Polarella glacialis]|mmetsp:Transcript_77926/g.209157  ORF Transcript_77926/g.209157 Transcript_77926/m.209157 type:complete len:126 (-) Transcript_77926:113-490(-)